MVMVFRSPLFPRRERGRPLENSDFLPYYSHGEKDQMVMMNLIYPIIFGARGLNTKISQTIFCLILS